MVAENLQNKNRFVHLDLLRIIAIFFVIYNHTGSNGYMLFASCIGSPVSVFYLIFSILCKIAVPLFFLVSGALLLKKEETLKQLFFKRIFRMIIVLVLVSVPYYYWLHRDNGTGFLDFFRWIYTNSASSSLWYLYSYIALLLMLPFLRSMVKNMKQQDFVYLFIGNVIFVGVLPCLEYLLTNKTNMIHNSFTPIIFVTQSVFFVLMGYYFEHVYDITKLKKKHLFFCVLSSVVAILLTCFITYYQTTIEICTPHQLERFFDCFICIPAFTVFILIKRLGISTKKKYVGHCISIAGSAVFGVYLIEKIIRSLLIKVYDILQPFVGSFFASLFWSFAVLVISLLIIVVLKRIPVIKKLVNKLI